MAKIPETFQLEIIKRNERESEIREKEDYVRSKRTERNYQREKDLESRQENLGTLTDVFCDDIFTSTAPLAESAFARDIKRRQEALKESVPFIHSSFSDHLNLIPGEWLTIAAYSGQGKSTSIANAAATFIEHGKRVLIISNEESATNFQKKIASIIVKTDPTLIHNQAADGSDYRSVLAKVREMREDRQLAVLDHELSDNGTAQDAYILNLLNKLSEAQTKPDVVFIDYLTNIYSINCTSSDNRFMQLDHFCSEVKNLINTLPFPLVMAAQLHSDDKRKGSSLDSKMLMGGSAIRYATSVIEIHPYDTETQVTKYTIHKSRHGRLGTLELRYEKGRMLPFDPIDIINEKVGAESTQDS